MKSDGRRHTHGPSQLPRLPRHQRRLRPAFPPGGRTAVPRSRRTLSGPHQQQDQRHHLPPLAAPRQPRPHGSCSSKHSARRRAGWMRGTLHAAWKHMPTTPISSRSFAAPAPATQAGARRHHRRTLRVWRSIPAALFDVQVKRLHEYKRQLLNIVQTVAQYDAIRAQPMKDWPNARQDLRRQGRAPATARAKAIIRLIHDVAWVINNDPVGRRPAEGGLSAQLQRQPRRTHHARRRSLRTDLHRRAWKPPAPAT